MSQPPRNQRERNGGNYGEKRDRERDRERKRDRERDRERDARSRRDAPGDRRSASDRTSSQSSYYPRGSQRRGRSAPQDEHHESKCNNICSRRGIVLICAVLTNALVLICIVTAYMSQVGMSAMGMGGASFVDAIIPFEGTELQQVRDLDMQYGQMRAPGVYGAWPSASHLVQFHSYLLCPAANPPHRLPPKLLIGQFAFQIIGAAGYVIAVGLYLHFVISVNSTDVCARRERLYARNGYTWINCSVSGGDAAVALFGLITAILYTVGAVLTGQTLRDVSRYYKSVTVMRLILENSLDMSKVNVLVLTLMSESEFSSQSMDYIPNPQDWMYVNKI